MDIETLYQKFKQCSGVITDTRNVVKDAMFIALKGPNFDANLFAADALKNGCKYAVVDDPKAVTSEYTILVEDCLTSLQQLARHHRLTFSIPFIGITGTNGKTTTKELMNAVLSTRYKVIATHGNLNNHIGVPLTLLNVKNTDEIAIIEMGANHVGEIDFLCGISRPDYGLITNIGKAHLEGFGSFENIIDTKKALYENVIKNNGLLFINHSDDLLLSLSNDSRCVYYQTTESLNGIVVENDSGTLTFRYKTPAYQSADVKTNLIGNYNLNNVMAVIAVGMYFNISFQNIEKALVSYQPENNRSQWLETNNNKIILDAYNANPTSLMAALEHFKNMKADHKIAILGDMLELGAMARDEHQKMVDFLHENQLEAFFVGSLFSSCENINPGKIFLTADDLIESIKRTPLTGKTILLKGSRGIRLEKLVAFL